MAPKQKTGVYELGGGLCVGVRCVKSQPYVCIQKNKPGVGKNRSCVLLSKTQLKNLVEANEKIMKDLEVILGFKKKPADTQDSATQTEDPQINCEHELSSVVVGGVEGVEPSSYNIEDSYSYLSTMPTIDELLKAMCGSTQP